MATGLRAAAAALLQHIRHALSRVGRDEEALQLLASNGMLVKRPLLVVDGVPAAPGFKEAAWRQALGLPQEQ